MSSRNPDITTRNPTSPSTIVVRDFAYEFPPVPKPEWKDYWDPPSLSPTSREIWDAPSLPPSPSSPTAAAAQNWIAAQKNPWTALPEEGEPALVDVQSRGVAGMRGVPVLAEQKPARPALGVKVPSTSCAKVPQQVAWTAKNPRGSVIQLPPLIAPFPSQLQSSTTYSIVPPPPITVSTVPPQVPKTAMRKEMLGQGAPRAKKVAFQLPPPVSPLPSLPLIPRTSSTAPALQRPPPPATTTTTQASPQVAWAAAPERPKVHPVPRAITGNVPMLRAPQARRRKPVLRQGHSPLPPSQSLEKQLQHLPPAATQLKAPSPRPRPQPQPQAHPHPPITKTPPPSPPPSNPPARPARTLLSTLFTPFTRLLPTPSSQRKNPTPARASRQFSEIIAQMPGSYPKSLGPEYSKVAVGGEEKKEKREVVDKAPQRPLPVADPGGRRCGKGG